MNEPLALLFFEHLDDSAEVKLHHGPIGGKSEKSSNQATQVR